MKRQEISLENQRRMVGEIIEVLVAEIEGLACIADAGQRSAPDEVDGIVMLKVSALSNSAALLRCGSLSTAHDFKGVKCAEGL